MAGGALTEAAAPIEGSPQSRRDAVRAQLETAGSSALLVSHPANVRYLSDFTGSAGILVLFTTGTDRLYTNFLYQTQAPLEIDAAIELEIVKGPLFDAIRKDLKGSAPIGFEAAHVTVEAREAWRKKKGPKLEPAGTWIEDLRAVKSIDERAAIARAAAIADRVFSRILEETRPGVTERGLAARLDFLLAEEGSEKPAFETIVAFGERSALPHATPTARTLAKGEVVLFDFGAVVDGYASDMSRTVACGELPPELADVYQVVLTAQQAAIDGLRPGLTGREADKLARDSIEASGYGPEFGHSLGHGIGLEVHEAPRLYEKSKTKLQPATVVTVEPAIYIEGFGGVRIEDDVVVGSDGNDVLTRSPRDHLIVL